MNFGKVVVSFLLLLTYSFGFMHNLIPHYEELESHNYSSANHQHHQHTLNDDVITNYDHILHDNHFDEDLLDLIICFFSETKHANIGCDIQHYLPGETIDISKKELTKVKLVAILFSFVLNAEQSEPVFIIETDLKAKYLSQALANSPYRGPPSNCFLLTEA